MIRFLIRLLIYFLSALIGIIAADALLSGVSVNWPVGVIEVAVIYTIIQAILAPMVERGVRRNARAFSGGVGLISTFAALVITAVFSSLSIDGVTTWILATLIVWLFTAIANWILPLILVKKVVEERRS